MENELLKLLENDARASAKSMATMLGISEEKVEQKIRELKKKGAIRGFKTIVDWKKLGLQKAHAIINVKVVPQSRTGFAKICKDISKDPKVKDIFVVTGEYDLAVIVEVDNLDQIGDFVTEKLAPKKEVLGTNTQIIMREFKRDGALFFDEENKRLALSP